MHRLIIFLILLLFISCSSSKDNTTSLKIGQVIPSSAISKNIYFVTTSSLSEQTYSYEENNMTFDIMTNKKGLITFFKPLKDSFITPCGIQVGDNLEKVLRISKKEPKNMPGWGYFILLPSGWFVGLGKNTYIQTSGKLSSDSKVIFLFKSKYHGSWYD